MPTDSAIPPVLATASWFTRLPQGYVRISIARGPMPKGVDLNTMRYACLTPRQSVKTTAPALFHRNYLAALAALDPEFLFEDIKRMGGTRVPVLCAWTGVDSIAAGRAGCHRHLAADWFERALDIRVPEIGAPRAFDRFIYWRAHPVLPSTPGERPRTGPYLAPVTKADRARARFGQYRFKL